MRDLGTRPWNTPRRGTAPDTRNPGLLAPHGGQQGNPGLLAPHGGQQAAAPVLVTSSHSPLTRLGLARVLAVAWVLAYNWWILVPLRPGLMRSPSELFSNLEVTGRPFAAAMQDADLLAGVLLLGAFLAAGSRSVPDGRREWSAMMAFAASGALGGLFPEVCADGVNALCRSMEWKFQLPASQYLHGAAGILEFGSITVALLLAFRRTRGQATAAARAYRGMVAGALVAYPLLGLSYLLNRLGGVMEAIFFIGFTAMVLTQIFERTE